MTLVLRLALIKAWTWERADLQHVWHPFQDVLASAPGPDRKEAFGAQTHLAMAASHLHRWTVTLLCVLSRSASDREVCSPESTLKEEIAQGRKRWYGLSTVERAALINGSADAYLGI